MAWGKFTWVENVTKAIAARFNNEEEGIEEAKAAESYSVLNYGTKGDIKRVIGVKCSTASVSVEVKNAAFTAADVGKWGICYEDFKSGVWRQIESILSATEVKLSGEAGITINKTTEAYFTYGTDDTAAFTACVEAANNEQYQGTVGFNEPLGLGQGAVVVPALPNNGAYLLRSQLTIPSGTIIDCPGMIVNALASRTEPVLLFKPWSTFKRLYVECLFGAGIQIGEAEGQAACRGDLLTLWHVGEEEIASVPQRGVYIDGTGVLIDSVWMKGGFIGIQHQPGSDTTINRAHLIGCKEGIQANKVNMLHYGVVILDTCGAESGTFYGVSINEEASNVSFGQIKAFEINSSAKKLAAILALGVKPNTKKVSIIEARISANRTGGDVLLAENCQDIKIDFEASNLETPSSKTTQAITTGVVFGTVAGNCLINGAMTGSITPYSGTSAGTYNYTRTSNRYCVTGASVPTPAAGANNGGAPPAPTASGSSNGSKGVISFGSGTTPAAGEQVTVTYSDTTGYVVAPVVVPIALNAATQELGLYISESSATKFVVSCSKAPAASQTTGKYQFSYAAVG